MSLVTVIWSMVASACFTLAMLHLLIWFWNWRSWASLCFCVLVAGVIGVTAAELAAMYAGSPEEFGRAIRWGHFAFGFVLVGSLGFVHFYFGTGNRWLLGVALGLRLLALVANFNTGLNLHINAIDSLQKVNFFGEQVAILGEWTPNPWRCLGQVAALVQFFYVADASLRLWRNGSRDLRRRALIVGAPLAFFIVFASAQAGLIMGGVLRMPVIVSFPFLAVLVSMSYELSRDVLRAAQLAVELRESGERLMQASHAAGFGVYEYDFLTGRAFYSPEFMEFYGLPRDAVLPLDADSAPRALHPDDKEHFVAAMKDSHDPRGSGVFDTEYRVFRPDGTVRWLRGKGRTTFAGKAANARPLKANGIVLDISDRKQAELEFLRSRAEINHLSRVAMLGELSGSIAHELNQPLTAILSNAQAAQRFLSEGLVDINEIRDILKDIVADDQRAGEVIRRLRLLLKKGEVDHRALDLNEVVQDVLKLIRSELLNHNVTLQTVFSGDQPVVRGDRVQLQQVLLNLIMNATEAMAQTVPGDEKKLTVTTRICVPGEVAVSVADAGVGLTPDIKEQLFMPFFTTKATGMGLGLKVCRTIIAAHGGRLDGQNNAGPGATFSFILPAVAPEPREGAP